MRLIIVNPNTTVAITDMLLAQARQIAAPGVRIDTVTAGFGVAAVESSAEAAIAGHAVIRAFADAGDADAGIVSAFADPGLAGARAAMPYPIVGIGESSMLTACALGGRFAVVTAGRNTAPAIARQVHDYHLEARFAGVRSIAGSLLDIAADQDAFGDALVDVVTAAAVADHANAVILGGAVFVGMVERIRDRVPVPVLDPIRCAVLQAEALMRLGLRNRAGEAQGLPPFRP